MLTVFSGSRRTAAINTTLTEMQESARFALDSMVREVRLAGFQGCVDVSTSAAVIRADDAPTEDLFVSAVAASRVGPDGSWDPPPPIGMTPPVAAGAPLPGTDALSVQFGNPETRAIEPMAQASSPIVLRDATAADSGLRTGDLALIADCRVADLFLITAAAGSTLQHGPIGNGNDVRLSAPYGAGAVDTLSAEVMRFEANVYFVGDTGRRSGGGDPVLALYRQALPYTSAPVEMIEGVANLKLRLGFGRPEGDGGEGLIYVAAADSDDPMLAGLQVESVEIGLLMQSREAITDTAGTRSWELAGTRLSAGTAGDGAATHYPSDRRLRLAFNTSVRVRNRR